MAVYLVRVNNVNIPLWVTKATTTATETYNTYTSIFVLRKDDIVDQLWWTRITRDHWITNQNKKTFPTMRCN